MKIRACEILVRENCRRTHGIEGAIDEALRRVKVVYMDAMTHECNEAAKFNILMTLERR